MILLLRQTNILEYTTRNMQLKKTGWKLTIETAEGNKCLDINIKQSDNITSGKHE